MEAKQEYRRVFFSSHTFTLKEGSTRRVTDIRKCKLFATQALSQTQKNVSVPQTGIEPATF